LADFNIGRTLIYLSFLKVALAARKGAILPVRGRGGKFHARKSQHFSLNGQMKEG
jgi:hypothetical protein